MTLPASRDLTFVAGTSQIPAATMNRIQDLLVSGIATTMGSGVDGAAVADGAGAIPGATRSGSVYTLTRDVFYTDLTVSAGVEIKRAGFRMFCNGTATIPATAKVTQNGITATNRTGATGAPNGTLVGGAAGGDGGTRTGGAANDGDPENQSNGGAGGAGGDGDLTGGAGGLPSVPAAIDGGFGSLWTLQTGLIAGITAGNAAVAALRGGCGGGGGSGGDDGVRGYDGGGGGSGAGVGVFFARVLILNGTIECNGGDGADAFDSGVGAGGGAAGAGGGGGGGGGDNMVVCGTMSGSGSVTSTGGAGGAGIATGNDGVDGADGRVLIMELS